MDLFHEGSGSGEEDRSDSRKGKKQCHQNSAEQTQQLEAMYKDCPHPDENQRRDLSRQLGLDPEQIAQTKIQNERADSNALQSENVRIYGKNLSMQETLGNAFHPDCNDSGLGEEDNLLNLQKLRMENAQRKEECERAVGPLSNYMGKSIMPPPGTSQFSNMPGKASGGEDIGTIHPLNLEQIPWNSENPTSAYQLSGIQEMGRSSIIETAISAMDELMELLRVKEPIWIKSPTDGRYLLHRDTYDKLYPKPNYFKTTSARFESSKESGEVAVAASQLIEILLDSNKRKDMFCTVVTKAKTIEILDTGAFGGSLHLMYEKMHILSPLMAPREFFFIRYCRQLNSSTWVMVDVSSDCMKELQDADTTYSWKLPSGCMIEDMTNGKSTITWIEHVQLDDNASSHHLYRDLVYNCQAYGAKRWIATLQRACERFAFSMGLTTAPKHEIEGVIDSPEGRRNLLNLSHRMVNDFCEELDMLDKLDFPSDNSGIRISFRKGTGLGQPDGLILSAATSLWLPLSHENLFEFFKDEKKRAQWDVLSDGNPVNAIAQISTGIHPGNCISIIQPFVTKENNMMMLQETSTDSLGAMMIYAPVDLPTISSVVNGEDPTKVAILPSGYVISGDGRSNSAHGTSSSSSGSLLTVAFQILLCYNTMSKQRRMESVAAVHNLLSSTVEKIRVALDCAESD